MPLGPANSAAVPSPRALRRAKPHVVEHGRAVPHRRHERPQLRGLRGRQHEVVPAGARLDQPRQAVEALPGPRPARLPERDDRARPPRRRRRGRPRARSNTGRRPRRSPGRRTRTVRAAPAQRPQRRGPLVGGQPRDGDPRRRRAPSPATRAATSRRLDAGQRRAAASRPPASRRRRQVDGPRARRRARSRAPAAAGAARGSPGSAAERPTRTARSRERPRARGRRRGDRREVRRAAARAATTAVTGLPRRRHAARRHPRATRRRARAAVRRAGRSPRAPDRGSRRRARWCSTRSSTTSGLRVGEVGSSSRTSCHRRSGAAGRERAPVRVGQHPQREPERRPCGAAGGGHDLGGHRADELRAGGEQQDRRARTPLRPNPSASRVERASGPRRRRRRRRLLAAEPAARSRRARRAARRAGRPRSAPRRRVRRSWQRQRRARRRSRRRAGQALDAVDLHPDQPGPVGDRRRGAGRPSPAARRRRSPAGTTRVTTAGSPGPPSPSRPSTTATRWPACSGGSTVRVTDGGADRHLRHGRPDEQRDDVRGGGHPRRRGAGRARGGAVPDRSARAGRRAPSSSSVDAHRQRRSRRRRAASSTGPIRRLVVPAVAGTSPLPLSTSVRPGEDRPVRRVRSTRLAICGGAAGVTVSCRCSTGSATRRA